MSDKQTCCVAYGEALAQYTGGDPEKVKLFAAGFVHGQAEKVALGACHAAMFRPAPQYVPFMQEVVADAGRRYGLSVFAGPDREMWITSRSESVQLMLRQEKNSHHWHMYRAMLCGVPYDQIDLAFHERQGYGVQPDSIAPEQWTVASPIDLAKFNVTEIVNAGKTFVPTKKYAGFSPSGVCLESDDGVTWSEVKERA